MFPPNNPVSLSSRLVFQVYCCLLLVLVLSFSEWLIWVDFQSDFRIKSPKLPYLISTRKRNFPIVHKYNTLCDSS